MRTTGVDVLVSRSLKVRPLSHWNLEDFEVAGGDRHPAAAAVKRTLASAASGRPTIRNGSPYPPCERHAAGRACVHDSRDRAQLLDAVADHLLHRLRLLVLHALQRHLQRQHVVRVESGIDAPEGDRRADQERRPDQQHQRQRHLDDDQGRSHLVLTEPRPGPSRAFLQRGGQVRLRALQRRDQAENQARWPARPRR